MDAETRALVARALAEDVGTGDVTTEATVGEEVVAVARITQKAPGVLSGIAVAEEALRQSDPSVTFVRHAREGEWREGGPVLEAHGRARALLTAERTALNLLQRLSGVATLTARCVRELEGTGVRLLDTRKTTPGLRALEKAAVRAGGGDNHRAGLYDAVLIKENHIAAAGGIGEAVRRARAAAPELPLEVEVRDEREIDEALGAGAPCLLLDNMGPEALAAAVARVAGRAELEASGGIGPASVRAHAVPGLDFISLGAVTHSAPALDLSMLVEVQP